MPEQIELRIGAALAALAFGAIVEPAAASAELFHAEPTKPWGTPRRVLPPEYPKEALEKRHTGHVDIEGVVTFARTFTVLSYTPDSEASRVFIEPLKKVIGHWTYYGRVGNDCRPIEEKTVTRVWFELDGDRPKISVSSPTTDKQTEPRLLQPVRRVEPRYPESMRRKNLQANVYTRMMVNGAGDVIEVSAHSYPEGNDRRPFVRETEAALKEWKYPPSDRETRTVCMDAVYRLY